MLCFEDCNIVSNIIKFCNDCLENPNSLQKKSIPDVVIYILADYDI